MRSFFKSLLGFFIGAGDHRTRLPQPELQLVKQSLTLPHSQHYLLLLGDMMGQERPVPEILRISEISRRFSQIMVDIPHLVQRKPLGTSLPFPVLQAAESSRLEALDPSLNRRRVMAKKLTYLVGRHTPARKQYSVKTVIISRFLGPMNLVLQSDFHYLPVGDLQTFHLASSPPS
jgi:hypothetical protein